jgi:hypothetical protein
LYTKSGALRGGQSNEDTAKSDLILGNQDKAILNAPLTLTDDKLDYTAPNSARIE